MKLLCAARCGVYEIEGKELDKQLRREDQQFRCPECGDLAISENQTLPDPYRSLAT